MSWHTPKEVEFMRRKGIILFLLACLPWLSLPVLTYFDLALWGAGVGLVIILSLFFLMPAGKKWGILQAFSLLFFLVACAVIFVLGDDVDTRIPNLLAGGFACLTIMAGYGALEGIYFPAHYLYLDHPESMRESPILRQSYWVLTLAWDAIFISGLVANIIFMLALSGDTSISTSCTVSAALFAAGMIATPLIMILLPKHMESALIEKGPLSIKWSPTVLEPGRHLRKNEYDAVVVGSGIGGLACASLLSHTGMKVMVAERARLIGGYCQTYDWEGFPLNSGPTMLLGGGEGGTINALLRRLGLEKEVPMRRLEWGLADGKIALRLGQGFEEDMAKLAQKFPTSQDEVKRLFADLRRFRGEFRDRPDFLTSSLPSSLDEYHEQFVRHPVSALWQNLSFKTMLEDYLSDDTLVSLLGRTVELLGGDPRHYPAYEGARLLCSLFIDGVYYPRNHLSHLSQKLAGVVKDGGGEVLTSCGAEEVLVQGEGTRAKPIGLRLADGTQVRSNVVVLDIDPRRALTGLVQPSSLGDEFVKEMHKLRCSNSAFVLHLVFNKDLRLPERVFLMLPKPRRVRTGSNYMEVDSLILSKERCTIKDKPGCVLLARVNVPNHSYPVFEDAEQNTQLGAELTAMVKEEIAHILPAVKKAAKEFVTMPTHFSRLTSNGQGAAFGFAPLSTQWYYRRPGPRMSLSNLYLVGAWSRFGGGMEGAALSGAITARELCGERPYGGAAGTRVTGRAEGHEASAKAKPAKKSRLPRRKKKKEGEADEEE